MTHAEIAKHFGCSAENIRKIERKALRKLADHPDTRSMLEQYKDCKERHTFWDKLAEM